MGSLKTVLSLKDSLRTKKIVALGLKLYDLGLGDLALALALALML